MEPGAAVVEPEAATGTCASAEPGAAGIEPGARAEREAPADMTVGRRLNTASMSGDEGGEAEWIVSEVERSI